MNQNYQIFNIFSPVTIINGVPMIFQNPPNVNPMTHQPFGNFQNAGPTNSFAPQTSAPPTKENQKESSHLNRVKDKICKDPKDEEARKNQAGQERRTRQKISKLAKQLEGADSGQKILLEKMINNLKIKLQNLRENRRNKVWKESAPVQENVIDNDSLMVVDELDEMFNNYKKNKTG